jgi:uncharacterized protein YgiM (DUF1202 family)
VLGVAAVIAFFVILNPPPYNANARESNRPAEASGGGSIEDGDVPGLSEARIQVVPSLPTIIAPEVRAKSVLTLKTGPDSRYTTVGQIQNGAKVDVVGRNEKGDWLAVSLTPGAKTYGWVPASGVAGVTNVQALPVTPVTLLR